MQTRHRRSMLYAVRLHDPWSSPKSVIFQGVLQIDSAVNTVP